MPNPGANHYFSMAALPHFPKDIQNKVNNNKSAFLLGAQVMELLKIYRPEKTERLKRIGLDEYMQNIETIAKSSDAVLACAAGFLCAKRLEEIIGNCDSRLSGEIDRVFMLKAGIEKPHREKLERLLPKDPSAVKAAAFAFGLERAELSEYIKKCRKLLRLSRFPLLFPLVSNRDKLKELHVPKAPKHGALPASVVNRALNNTSVPFLSPGADDTDA